MKQAGGATSALSFVPLDFFHLRTLGTVESVCDISSLFVIYRLVGACDCDPCASETRFHFYDKGINRDEDTYFGKIF